MKKQLIAVTAFLMTGSLVTVAQHFKVDAVQQVRSGAPMGAFHPVFSPDGKSLLVTAEDYSGLAVVNLEKPSYRLISSMDGAGYKAEFSEDGTTVIARNNHLDEQTMDLYAIDVKTAVAEELVQGLEHTNRVSFKKGALNYAQKGKLRSKGVATRRLKAATATVFEDVFVTEEDLKIVVYRNGIPTVIDPLSTPEKDVNYCWTELSPDKKKIVFVAGQDAYTCNIDGSGVKKIGNIRAPKWRDIDYIVGMNDTDDGHNLTSSDIVIVRNDGADYQQLTNTSSDIKMFPSVSPDGNRIAYHTTRGEIYIMSISENK